MHEAAIWVGREYHRRNRIHQHQGTHPRRVPSYSNNKEALENNTIQDFGILEGASEYPSKILNFHWDWIHSHLGAKSNDYSFYRHCCLSSATK
jgi:hypothetical protein